MKTVHYTFTTWNERAMASGFDGAAAVHQAALIPQRPQKVRTLGGDNIIDLSAWRAANLLEEDDPLEEWDWADEGYEEREEPELYVPASRPRKSRRAAVAAELIATVGVVAAALAVILGMLAI